MLAIRPTQTGGPEVLVLSEHPPPSPQAARAHEALAGRQTTGKVLLLP